MPSKRKRHTLDKSLWRFIVLLLISPFYSSAIALTAEGVYANYQDSVMQIRIIETKAESQHSMGSGFFVADGSLIATNYHVVSSLVMESENFRSEIEFLDQTHVLELLHIDVINDLALLKSPVKGVPLNISIEPPQKGSRLFSIGNPHDIGKSLVEGNYNGLVSDRFYDQIHFSGAINSGMSGGPTLNDQGEVVGINVATAGNQVGFLVPSKYLADLITRSTSQESVNFTDEITRQVGDATTHIIDDLLASEWPLEPLGEAMILGKVHHAIECWGDSDDNEETQFRLITKGCLSRDNIFIDQRLNTGFIEYEFSYYEAEDWPSQSFYNRLGWRTSRAGPGNRAGKKSVTNYRCSSEIVAADDQHSVKRRISYCVRAYKKFSGLFDVLYISASLDHTAQAVSGHYTLSGVTQDAAQRFLKRFIAQVSWK